jgi:hypothetical protein
MKREAQAVSEIVEIISTFPGSSIDAILQSVVALAAAHARNAGSDQLDHPDKLKLTDLFEKGDQGAYVPRESVHIRSEIKSEKALKTVVVTLLANKIRGNARVSGRRVITPLLKRLDLYDGNVRSLLANSPLIIRKDDDLSLAPSAQQEAIAALSALHDLNSAHDDDHGRDEE